MTKVIAPVRVRLLNVRDSKHRKDFHQCSRSISTMDKYFNGHSIKAVLKKHEKGRYHDVLEFSRIHGLHKLNVIDVLEYMAK